MDLARSNVAPLKNRPSFLKKTTNYGCIRPYRVGKVRYAQGPPPTLIQLNAQGAQVLKYAQGSRAQMSS